MLIAPDTTPLCVDLDGTLIRSDLLVESITLLCKHKPWLLFALPFWMLKGRAALKQQLATHVSVRPSLLPYNEEFVRWIKEEKSKGRKLILVTASDRIQSQPIADHVAVFDEVMGSDGKENLKGRNKLHWLEQRYGRNFDYAGNSQADLVIWAKCRNAVVVNASSSVLKAARSIASVARVFERKHGTWRQLLRVIRIHQWAKNLLIFVPVLTSHNLGKIEILWTAFLCFLSFSFSASGVYVMNDLLDLEADRRHSIKKRRPFASGALPLAFGFILTPITIGTGLLISLALPQQSTIVLLLYLLLTASYSMQLKRILLVDVFTLATLYTLRIIAGCVATGIDLSFWLLTFSMFLFVSLGFCKRTSELYNLRKEGGDEAHGRSYRISDLEQLNVFGVASGVTSALVFALYMNSDNVRALYQHPLRLWSLFPLLLYWISRVWIIAHRGQMNEDPVSFAIKDRVTWLTVACAMILLLFATR